MSLPIDPREVVTLIQALDSAFEHGGMLLADARQRDPRLNVEPLPHEGDAMRAARARALAGVSPDPQNEDD